MKSHMDGEVKWVWLITSITVGLIITGLSITGV